MKRRAFTLIELLVVLSIIALLISILMPTLERTRRAAKVIGCSANLKQYALGMVNYAADDASQHFPISPEPNVAGLPIWSLAAAPILGEFDRNVYLDMFEDVIFGGNFAAINCPLDCAYNPTCEAGFVFGGSPQHSDVWLRGGFEQYWSGYRRFGNLWEPASRGGWASDADFWVNSGTSDVDSAPKGPGSSQDMILVDRTVAEPGGKLQEPHMRFYYTVTPASSLREHREVNAAYADGHAESRGSAAYIDNAGYITWADARWLPHVPGFDAERLIW